MSSARKGHFFLMFLTGLLLFAAWPMSPLTFLIFLALVPLFWVEAKTINGARFFWIVLVNMLIWNAATTWWIWEAQPGGAAGAIVANSLLMCFPWMMFRFTKKKAGDAIGYLSFILYWTSFEYLHHNWDLSWPWLTLGNVFSTSPGWVQWYSYTGTTGGTLWVLIANVLLFKTLQQRSLQTSKKMNIKYVSFFALMILLPLVFSMLSFKNIPASKSYIPNNVVVVQPNVHVDARDATKDEKFNTDPALLIERMIRQSESKIDTNTRLVVWPETAIPVQVWENQLPENGYYKAVYDFVRKHPPLMLLTGIDSYRFYGTEDPGHFSVRKDKSGNFYEAYNTAMAVTTSAKTAADSLPAAISYQLYHKSKLVPGAEILPSFLGFLSKAFDDFGGGMYGRSDSAIVFRMPANPYQPAPIICYESIYSNYVTDYVRRGANLLTIITNDGWWGNTPGYKQHMSMAQLRAIETRCWVARSANTGISCFIDPQGNVLEPQPWDTAAAIKLQIPPVNEKTFYVQYGDWLSRLAWPLGALAFAWSLVVWFRKKK